VRKIKISKRKDRSVTSERGGGGGGETRRELTLSEGRVVVRGKRKKRKKGGWAGESRQFFAGKGSESGAGSRGRRESATSILANKKK